MAGDFGFVIDSSFKPYSFQEMLAPLAMYKDLYDKTEEAYSELQQKADKFKYLADNLDPNSDAAKIYTGYAEELKSQAEDLANNGLSIGSRRALTNLRRRYQGEIGQLYDAKEALDKELELRRQMGVKDPSMLYGTDNLNIDSFLGSKRPNLYGISGNYLYTKGATLGKAVSSRMYNSGDEGSTLGGYYRLWKEQRGIKGADISEFMNSQAVQDEVDKILQAEGVEGNLTGSNYQKARQQILNGIYTGIIYEESAKPVRDAGVLSETERRADARAARAQAVEEAMNGISWVGGKPIYDKNNDLKLQKQLELIKEREAAKAAGKTGSGRSGAAYDVRNKEAVIIGGNSGTIYKSKGAEGDGKELDEMNPRALSSQEYNNLIDAYGNINNEYIRNAIGNGNLSDYEIYIIPSGSTEISGTGWFDNDDLNEDVYIIKPRESKRAATNDGNAGFYGSSDTNDIPD